MLTARFIFAKDALPFWVSEAVMAEEVAVDRGGLETRRLALLVEQAAGS